MKLSLAIIAKDQVDQIRSIIEKYQGIFDEIVIAGDMSHDRFGALTGIFHGNERDCVVKYYQYEWKDDFADKRNFVASKCTGDYYFRLDTDDVIISPEKVRAVAEKALIEGTSIVYCWYDYSRDQWGNTNAGHYRETIIKNTPNLYWNKPVHENILPRGDFQYTTVINKELSIYHDIDSDHAAKAAVRNIRILIKEYDKDKENTDPRTLAYLGKMFFSVQDFDKAIFFLQKHIEKSGWDEDRYLSWIYISNIFLMDDKYKEATAAAFEALQEMPQYPQAYNQLHDICFSQQQFRKAIEWGESAIKRSLPDTFVLQDPSYEWRLALSMAFCYQAINEHDKALKMFNYAKKKAPTLDYILDSEKSFIKKKEDQDYYEHFMWMVSYLRHNDNDKIEKLISSIPDEKVNSSIVMQLNMAHVRPRIWGDDEVVIFCGRTEDPWAAPSIVAGIGGSETAVIQISKELTRLGKKVTVYCNCDGLEGEYDGVFYKQYGRLNPADNFNTFISWRGDLFAKTGLNARKKIVWLHDNPKHTLPEEGTANFDTMIVLSEYHKSLLPAWVPENKIYVSTNGIDKDMFNVDVPRETNRIIYASSYDRGLELILDNWDKIREKKPDAELHLFYGWNTYDKYTKMGMTDGSFKKMLAPKMLQEGIFEHGRIGQKQLIKEYARSKVFAYPSNFEGEINCIALTQAIGAGCITVTNDHPIFKERNTMKEYCVKNEDFVEAVVKALDDTKDKKIDMGYVCNNSWTAVAEKWNEDIL